MDFERLNRYGRLCIVTIAVVGTAFFNGTFAFADPPNQDARPTRYALLIGVGKYPGLSAGEQLDGSANDVAAMREMLMGRFGFADEDITTLVDEQATGAGIRAAMKALLEAIDRLPADAPSAEVIVHFSGHGSQVPDQPDGPDRDEDDGLDETWVPYDAQKQGGAEDIRDDEINEFATALSADGRAQLLIIVDGCHSGTGARGATKVRQLRRDVAPTASSDAPITRKPLPDGVVFLSACRAMEVEPEYQDDNNVTYGLLNRFLVQTLSEQKEISALSYDLLQKAIVSGYKRDRRVMQAPMPQLEGSPASLKRTFLGFGPDVDLDEYYEVESISSSTVLVRAGRFQNITVGSLFDIYERPEQVASNDPPLASLRITKIDGTTSEAQVIRWVDEQHSKSVEDRLPSTFKKGLGVLRHREPSDVGLRVKVVRAIDSDNDGPPLAPNDPTLPKVIVESLSGDGQSKENAWLTWVIEPNQPCDLILRMDGHYASLFPSTGVAEVPPESSEPRGDVPETLRGGWGPIDLRTGEIDSDNPQDEKQQGLLDYLRAITKARNLISLAQSGADRSGSEYNVKLNLLKVDWDFDDELIKGSSPWVPDKEGRVVIGEDEVYGLQVQNLDPGNKPVYVTVLLLSPDMGISVEVPPDGPAIKLEPGETSEIFPLMSSEPYGTRQAILLATREPADFQFVAQSDLQKTRGGPADDGAGLLVEQLAEAAFFKPPATRGDSRMRRAKKTETSWSAQVVTWNSAP